MRKRLVESSRQLVFASTVRAGLPDRLRPVGETSASALLFHRFFDDGEPRDRGVERLCRQLEWLRGNFTPISLHELADCIGSESLPHRAVVVTCDDAERDLLDVVDIFKSFEIPLVIFVCAGWTAVASRATGEDPLARAVASIQWHDSGDINIAFSEGQRLQLTDSMRAINIDRLIRDRDMVQPFLEDLSERIEAHVAVPRSCCTWAELRDCLGNGVEVGAHSVSHVWLSQVSASRRHFEIAESKYLCETMLGPCPSFAYPYGMAETHSTATREEVALAGYSTAFLTHSDFITSRSDLLTLPRITLPDESISQIEFEARAGGIGIAARHLKAVAGRTRLSASSWSSLPGEVVCGMSAILAL